MSVVFINTFDIIGGAAIAAMRLHKHYLSHEIESTFLCFKKNSDINNVEQIVKNRYVWTMDTAIGRIVDKISLPYFAYISSLCLHRNKHIRKSSVIHLHNLHGGYFSLRGLLKFRVKKIVWTLHDMWAFTGNCAYSRDCNRWLTGCGDCQYLADYPHLNFDSTKFLWHYKQHVYEKLNLTIVCPSRWLYNKAKISPLLQRFKIYNIPNGIDVGVFKPMSKEMAKHRLGINPAVKHTLFVSNSLNDDRKGIDEFLKMLAKLDNIGLKLVVILVGKGIFNCPYKFNNIQFSHLEDIKDEKWLVDIYSAADFLCFTSKAENLPNVIIESMACGTPVISFNVGGVGEIVDNNQNGFLVEGRDTEIFCHRINELLSNESKLRRFGENSVNKIKERFAIDKVAKQYLKLYQLDN